MGSTLSSVAGTVGTAIGNVIAAPFKAAFRGSCKDICSGTWDIACFIEHLCVNDLVKLVMTLGLCYITFLLIYVLFKIGIFQCIGKTLCKMCWGVCGMFWYIFHDITCFLFYKLKNTKRVNHRHRRRNHPRDIERAYSLNSDSDFVEKPTRKQKSYERRHEIRQPARIGGRRHPHRDRLRNREMSSGRTGRSRRSMRTRPILPWEVEVPNSKRRRLQAREHQV